MKSNNMTTFIVVSGIIILVVFSAVLGVNLTPGYESNSYYAKPQEMNAKIDNISFKNDKLYITTSGNTKEICVKTTVSTPDINNICWNNVSNNEISISVYKNKMYYIWIKDKDNNISTPTSINTNK